MRRDWGSAVAVFLLTAVPAVGRADPPLYDASIDGVVDMIDHVNWTISIIPQRPLGETFRVAANCKVVLSRKPASFTRLEPGHRVSLTYDRFSSVVGNIIAIPGDQPPILRPKEKVETDDSKTTALKLETKPRRGMDTSLRLSAAAPKATSAPN
jgi:hypothetical protein